MSKPLTLAFLAVTTVIVAQFAMGRTEPRALMWIELGVWSVLASAVVFRQKSDTEGNAQ